ncbi:MAG: PilZ domain-containing protein [Desulfobulbaceae bacterium]|jgi:hypothetical protein|nr:PilZ domain-containing protein [Desulfobulbaceae bacterium]MDY0350919.1 PilZ domain-containing protein [Desulfobulbaceae bacterium]
MLHPNLMEYMLLFPLVLFFGLPAVIMSLVRLKEKMIKAGLRQSGAIGEQRKSPRREFDGIVAHASDGEHCSRVAVKNISAHGICFSCPPNSLNEDKDRLAVLLTGAGKNFQLRVQPKWIKSQGPEHSIGATIVDSLGRWDAFAGVPGRV